MKKGRHRRFEEARALKRSDNVDFDNLLDEIQPDDGSEYKPEHAAWADLDDAQSDDVQGDDVTDGEDPADEAESA